MAEIKRVIALGFFDGVHRGHGALLKKTLQIAKEIGATPSVLSFDIHPDTLVKGRDVKLINDAAARADLISRLYEIQDIIFIHFNQQVMEMAWQDFAETIIRELGAIHFVVGHDFRFGYGGKGNAGLLTEYCAGAGIGCDVVAKVELNQIQISSTYIRQLIARGDIEKANIFLGHPHELVDTVRYGYRLGRTIGAPTINMQFPEGVLIPRHGVYAAKVFLEDGENMAVTNIGTRPTVSGETKVTVESFILDFEGNLYGRQVRVEFYSFIRPEMKFKNLEELKGQIQKDAVLTREYFEKNP